MPEQVKWGPQDTALIYVVMVHVHTQSLKTSMSNLIQHSLGCAHPEFAKFAEEMEHAIERVELEE